MSFGGRSLTSGAETLQGLGIDNECTVFLNVRLRGGMMDQTSARADFVELRLPPTSVRQWLHRLGLAEFEPAFRVIGGTSLSHLRLLRPRDLSEMQMPPQHRDVLLAAIRRLDEGDGVE